MNSGAIDTAVPYLTDVLQVENANASTLGSEFGAPLREQVWTTEIQRSQNACVKWNRDGLRLDDLGRGGFKIFQNPSRFCFGMDAVLLAAFCRVKKGEAVLDLGTGNGILPLLLYARYPNLRSVTGLEIQREEAELARKNIEYNNLPGKIIVDEGDIKNVTNIYDCGTFDVVISNPPYKRENDGNIAKSEVLCVLDDVIRAAAHALKFGGNFFMVHRPHRLGEIFCACSRADLEVKTMRLVVPREGQKPVLALIRAKKGAKAGVSVEQSLLIYDKNGNYSTETDKIYND